MSTNQNNGNKGNSHDDQANITRQGGASKQSGTGGNVGARTGTQGGTHEQHVEAGRQSHKNDSGNTGAGNKQSDAGQAAGNSGSHGSGNRQSAADVGNASTGTRGGTPEQHAAAGRQSHKNDR